MDPRDPILVVVRWSHAAAAVALVGGSAFFVFILQPALRQAGAAGDPVRKAVEAGMKELVDVSLVVFIVTGALLIFERLSSGAVGVGYAAVLGLKIALTFFLYRWAAQVRRSRGWESVEARLLVGSGFLIVLLASVLKTLYEAGLRS